MSEQRRADLENMMAEVAFECSLAFDQGQFRRSMIATRIVDGVHVIVIARKVALDENDQYGPLCDPDGPEDTSHDIWVAPGICRECAGFGSVAGVVCNECHGTGRILGAP